LSDGGKNSELSRALRNIEKTLQSIQEGVAGLDNRISSLEQKVGQQDSFQQGNPLIFSRVLTGTLDAIREFENKQGQGIVAKDLARIRNVELPTIYDHLSKLEEANLISWQRGTELGLSPHNAKFYSLLQREKQLADIPVLMSLPDYVTPIAQAILKASKKGVSRTSLILKAITLKEQGEKIWKDAELGNFEVLVDDAIRILLRLVLISLKKYPNDVMYFVKE